MAPSSAAVPARALRAAVATARALGLRVDDPVVLRDGSNLVVHLRPAPIVARVATATAAVRGGDAWLAREVVVAGQLADAGAPVVAPTREVDPGPHVHDGFALSLWEHVREVPGPPDAAAAGRALRGCHAALAHVDVPLPRWAALDEAERVVGRLAATGAIGPSADAAALRALVAHVRGRVDACGLPEQAVHGDAHLGNVLWSARGPLWNDWEDVFHGPRAWDLGCLHASARPFGRRDPALVAAAAAGYGDDVPAEALAAVVDARRVQAALWGVLLGAASGDAARAAARLTWLRERAAALP
ncbi:phosphotransferase [Patulibacter sp. SYSU D01012]|uniref:phosphotransferase n=1 Tax=Patulibacter sp. SYSU D01012 TaxID=2817381 RepID=UPI001B314913